MAPLHPANLAAGARVMAKPPPSGARRLCGAQRRWCWEPGSRHFGAAGKRPLESEAWAVAQVHRTLAQHYRTQPCLLIERRRLVGGLLPPAPCKGVPATGRSGLQSFAGKRQHILNVSGKILSLHQYPDVLAKIQIRESSRYLQSNINLPIPHVLLFQFPA